MAATQSLRRADRYSPFFNVEPQLSRDRIVAIDIVGLVERSVGFNVAETPTNSKKKTSDFLAGTH
jgi:hypothetical protein